MTRFRITTCCIVLLCLLSPVFIMYMYIHVCVCVWDIYMYYTDPENVGGAGSLSQEVLDSTDVSPGAGQGENGVVIVSCVTIDVSTCTTSQYTCQYTL